MSDYEEVETEGWLSRITESIKGVLVGLGLFVISFPLLFWNEGRAVQTYKSLTEGKGAVVSVASDKIDKGNEGKLVHTSGMAKASSKLTDEMFGVSATGLKLNRTAEMYQWVEVVKKKTKKKAGGKKVTKKTYSYKKEWKKKAIDSSGFKVKKGHYNPDFGYSGKDWIASDAKMGAFTMSTGLVRKISNSQDVKLEKDVLSSVPDELRGRAKVSGNTIYVGKSSGSPKIGDMRFKFTFTPNTEVTVIAAQVGSGFAPYQTKAGDKLEMLEKGKATSDAMFASAEASNAMMTWILRLIGFIMMMAGIGMVFKPLVVVADVVPLIGDVLGMGVGIVAFAIAAPLTLLTIAFSWLFHRPILGVFLLLLAVGIGVGLKMMASKRKAAAGGTAAAA